MCIGWDPKRDNGVTKADVLASQPPLQALTGDDRTAEHAEEVKRALDRAAADANERSLKLADAVDSYFQHRGRAKKVGPDPKPTGADKSQDVERFVVKQIRGSVAPMPPLVVREFAAPRPGPHTSLDAPQDTVLWQPVIVLPTDGKATLNFHLGPARGGYQVVIAGHTADGRLGAVRGTILTTPSKTSVPSQFGPGGSGVPGGSVPPVVPVAPAKAPPP